MSNVQQGQNQPAQSDWIGDLAEKIIFAVLIVLLIVVILPFLIPVGFVRIGGEEIATKTRFWIVTRWQWVVNTIGALLVAALLIVEIALLTQWIRTGGASVFFAADDWKAQLLPQFGPWAIINFLAGALLVPVAWSIHRRRIAQLVRTRRISDVLRQERIEAARKRAADSSAAHQIGVRVDRQTGRITGSRGQVMTAPHPVAPNLHAFGVVNRSTVRGTVERFYDTRSVRDWVDEAGKYVVLPRTASSVRALIIAESGSGKTVLINGLILCALEYGWPVFMLDAKGDPADADALVAIAKTYGRSAIASGRWDFFNGTADQVTAKLMRLMPNPDGANQHYLDEIRGVLQAVQDHGPIRSVADLRNRLTRPQEFVRDQWDLSMVNKAVDKDGTTAGSRAMQSLLVALRPLESWISDDGWSYSAPKADVTVVPLSPVDDAQARLGDLLLLDLRNFLATRLQRRDKSPVVVIVDEFPQLVTGTSDPGDTAASLFETARSAGAGLVLAGQSPAGLSNDEVKRRRAMTSGAALVIGRSKDPEDVVKFAGTVMQMESSGAATGEELRSARAQHTYAIPPQDVRDAADGSFWIVQAGGIAAFRALPNRNVDPTQLAGATPPAAAEHGAEQTSEPAPEPAPE